jgi:predicted DNA-binding protein (UPF0251 family)
MPRPKLFRTIQSPPPIDGFNPSGAEQKGEVVLSFEEYESVRLIDFEGLDQSQAADRMGISRQTFGRVLKSARFIIAKALVMGFQLKVTGGCYQVRGLGHAHGQGNGSGRHGCRRRGINSMELEGESTGDTHMAENNKPSEGLDTDGNSNEKLGPGRGQGQGQGRGQGRGKGMGRGKGGGQGRGRGQGGGGKGGGNSRRS